MKKLAFVLILLLALAPLLFSSGSKEEGKDIITLEYWHSNSGILSDATDKLIESFNKTAGKENGINVVGIYQGKANDVLTKVKAVLLDGGEDGMPDIVQLDSTGVVDMANEERLLFVEDLASENGDDLSFLLPHAKSSMSYKGKTIGLPFNSSTILFYYNKTLYDKAGVKAPETIDDMVRDSRKLQDAGAEYALALVPTTYELCAFIGGMDGLTYLTDNKNGHDGTPTRTLFAENGSLGAFLEKWRELYSTGALSNRTSGVTSEFAAGNLAGMIASTANLTTILEMIDGRFELGVANLPKVNGEATGGVNLGGGALFTFKSTPERERAVWLFMKHMTSAESQMQWNRMSGYLPVNKGTYELDEYKEHTSEHPEFKIASEQLLSSNPAVTGLWIPSGYQVYYSFQSNIRKMLEENLPVSETVETMRNEIDGVLDEYASQNKLEH